MASMDASPKDKAEAVLRQYETLRAEVLGAISNGHHIVSVGLATVGGMSSLGLATTGLLGAATDKSSVAPAVVACVFGLGIPLVCLFVMYLAFGEFERTARACSYLTQIERQFNREIHNGCEVLSWHIWLSKNRRHMRYPYISTIVFFLLVAIASPVVWLGIGDSALWLCAIPWTMTAFLIVVMVTRTLWMQREYDKPLDRYRQGKHAGPHGLSGSPQVPTPGS